MIRPPKLYRWLYSDAIFRGPESEKTVYLTFDDGPNPEATPFVLDVLRSHGIKATFFLLGNNVLKYSGIAARIKEEGHLIANHGMNHLNGWQARNEDYTKDVMDGKALMESELFRPPYGKLGPMQYRLLRKTEKIVFWDVISGDFDQNIDGNQVLDNVVNNARNGSIIVMHDSKRAFANLKASLNETILQLSEKGYCFGTLNTLLDSKID